MKHAKIDTSPWSLGLPLVLLAACGPRIPTDEDDSATEDGDTVSTGRDSAHRPRSSRSVARGDR